MLNKKIYIYLFLLITCALFASQIKAAGTFTPSFCSSYSGQGVRKNWTSNYQCNNNSTYAGCVCSSDTCLPPGANTFWCLSGDACNGTNPGDCASYCGSSCNCDCSYEPPPTPTSDPCPAINCAAQGRCGSFSNGPSCIYNCDGDAMCGSGYSCDYGTNYCQNIPTPTPDVCGNGVCAMTENCSICSADCGNCSGPTATPTAVPTATPTPTIACFPGCVGASQACGVPRIAGAAGSCPTSPGDPRFKNCTCPVAPTPTNIPTATLTPTVAAWIKVRGGSVNFFSSVKYPPNPAVAYDGEDTNQPYLIVHPTGTSIGTGFSSNAFSSPVSSRDWKMTIPVSLGFTKTTFLSYIKSRKSATNVLATSFSNDSAIFSKDGIYIAVDGSGAISDLTITNTAATHFNEKNTVLIAKDVTFSVSTQKFSPTKATAIIADTLKFADTSANIYMSEANGIFIATTATTGTKDLGLKIKGNLVTSTFTQNRTNATNIQPAIFIVFDPSTYLTLLPYLSVSSYNWQQLQ